MNSVNRISFLRSLLSSQPLEIGDDKRTDDHDRKRIRWCDRKERKKEGKCGRQGRQEFRVAFERGVRDEWNEIVRRKGGVSKR